ncbi:MAG TPA: hypothetical protein VEI04_07145 [Syntrophobacteria bacterium]|nr:hypothetical protein [Syntrophobacteria bacterium]
MTQILSGITSEGIMVATDSTATEFDSRGEGHRFPVDKLFSVGSHAFIVSGGMGMSVELSLRLKRYAEERELLGIEAMIPVAGAFLSGQFNETLKASGRMQGRRDELERVYFLLGGYSFRSAENPYQLALWGSEAGEIRLKRIQVGTSVAIPRSLSAEVRLNRMGAENRPLGEVLDFAHQFLAKLAASNPDVGPPFRFGVVTPGGFKLVEPSRT